MQVSSNIDEILNLRTLEDRLPALREQYQSAQPYAHIAIDDVLTAPALAGAYSDFAKLDPTDWTNYLHVNERKFANKKPETWGTTLREIQAALSTPRFLSFLSQLTGFEALLPDPTLDGGGLHRTLRGAHLNIHADFTAHHTNRHWRRRVNLLLYLNPEWHDDWGGDLQIWDRDVSACQAKVAPLGNRIFLFSTDEHSFHGHPEPLNCPEGVARQSMALYYFTEEAHPLVKPTDYRARPGDGVKRLWIYLDKKALALYDVVKRRFKLSDKAVSNLLGKFSRKKP
ncbi:MAG: 2OG-Fe(II) oxygenase [Actinomycetia bacterium]|nr:2OG-Fe(II) oxygenase [Actinomycetes bacterium]